MYDSIATLIGQGAATYDKYGNETIERTRAEVFVMPKTVYASEFYQAAQQGLQPSITFEIANREDYSGEKIIEWNGVLYNVIRADWNAQRDKMRLVCEERVGTLEDSE